MFLGFSSFFVFGFFFPAIDTIDDADGSRYVDFTGQWVWAQSDNADNVEKHLLDDQKIELSVLSCILELNVS